ncbi:MAG: amidohydrolase family protein [Paludibacteraceae bacterium]|nr:amidohydrolase family protein [Paludibacteraceae bacterium]
MSKKILILMAIVATVITGCKDNKNTQPEIYDNLIVYGKIYTAKVDESKDNTDRYVMADAMVVKDGKFVYVGTKDGADSYKTENSKIIDCTGKGIIVPGMTDGHAHYILKYINEQMKDNTLQFTGDQSYEDVIEQVRKFVENAKKNGRHLDYVYGEGYNLANMIIGGKDLRNRKDLDSITTEIPIYLTGFDHHSTLVNTRAMINAGILDTNGNVIRTRIAGGFIYYDDNGEMTGVFSERAISLLQGPGLNNKMRPTSSQIASGIDFMQKYLLSVGITNIIEGWTNNYDKDDESLFKALTDLDRDNKLHLNVSLTYEIEPWYNNNDPFCFVDNAAAVKNKYQSKHVHPDYLKLFMDGLVEMGTGFILEEYKNSGEDSIYTGHGTPLWSEQDMIDLVKDANNKGLTVHTHALGDGAVHRCVVAYSLSGKDEMRNTIVHLRNVSQEDYAVIKEHNIAVSENMNWHCFTNEAAKHYETFLPLTYAHEAYPIKSFFNHGILVSQCTDTPADDGINNPFHCMFVAITGTYEPGMTPWQPTELIDRYQFLQAATYNGAWQLHLEKERGSIEAGKYADFVILDKDVLTCDVQELLNVQVLKTFFEGQEVFTR